MIVDILFEYIKNIFLVELKNFFTRLTQPAASHRRPEVNCVAFIIIFDKIIRLAALATVIRGRSKHKHKHIHVEK